MCDKRERFANKVWERLISEDSVHKDELDELFTVEYVNGLSGQIDDLSHTKKTRRHQTPVMTLRALQRLVMILGGNMASDFHRIVRMNVFLKALSKRSIPWSASEVIFALTVSFPASLNCSSDILLPMSNSATNSDFTFFCIA